MNEDLIRISQLNDFIFCPASIYFHNLYGNMETRLYQNAYQINGKKAHETVDTNTYSTKHNTITGIDVYSEQYGIVGKIDIMDLGKKTLIERKKKIKKIYDGYIYQLYGQYTALKEMGYDIKHLNLHSIDDNKTYNVALPEDDKARFIEFEKLIQQIRNFSLEEFSQNNRQKCSTCIYEPACDRCIA